MTSTTTVSYSEDFGGGEENGEERVFVVFFGMD
jgi:hypothetical protein